MPVADTRLSGAELVRCVGNAGFRGRSLFVWALTITSDVVEEALRHTEILVGTSRSSERLGARPYCV